jgi:hypothetical protein
MKSNHAEDLKPDRRTAGSREGMKGNRVNNIDMSAIDQDIRDHFEEMVRIRRHIHSHPEIGPEQPETVKDIKDLFIGMEDVTIIEAVRLLGCRHLRHWTGLHS